MITDTLTLLGLSPKEAKLYETILPLGAQPASVASRKLGISRSTAQFLAESLVKKGFATKSIRRKIIFYEPLHPEKLPKVLKKRKDKVVEEIDSAQKELERVLPTLVQSANQKLGKPKVKFFEGAQGLKEVYEDGLKAQESIRAFVSFEQRHVVLPNYFPAFYQKRAKHGVSMKAICPDTPLGKLVKKEDKDYLRKTRLANHKKYDWEPTIKAYDNKVTIASCRDQAGIIIESQPIADAFKAIFDLAWMGIKK